MSSKPNELAVGQWWRRRDGADVRIRNRNGAFPLFPFECSDGLRRGPHAIFGYSEAGERFDLIEYLGTEQPDQPPELAVGQWWRRRDGTAVEIIGTWPEHRMVLGSDSIMRNEAGRAGGANPKGAPYNLVEYLGTDQPEQPTEASRSDGSTASYYELPDGARELQDLISYRNMNAQDGEIFRAIYRKGRASHSDELRDARKVLFYAQKEVERLERFRSDER